AAPAKALLHRPQHLACAGAPGHGAAMSASAPARMTADDLSAWGMQQPARHRDQLVAGEVVVKTPPRAGHARAKGQIYAALRQAVPGAAPCCPSATARHPRLGGTM